MQPFKLHIAFASPPEHHHLSQALLAGAVSDSRHKLLLTFCENVGEANPIKAESVVADEVPHGIPVFALILTISGEEHHTEAFPRLGAFFRAEGVEHSLRREPWQLEELVLLDNREDGVGGKIGHRKACHRLLTILLEEQQGVLLHIHLEPINYPLGASCSQLNIANGCSLSELESRCQVAKSDHVQLAEYEHPHPIVHPAMKEFFHIVIVNALHQFVRQLAPDELKDLYHTEH